VRAAGALKRLTGPLLPRGAVARTIPVGPARGLRMEIDFSYQARMYLGIFEIELARWYRRFCAPGAAAFDVGAREGYVALVLARRSAGGRVVAFEADPVEFERLRRNIALNPSLARPPDARLARVTGRTGGKRDVTLDHAAFATDGVVPDLVKLDVEGWELKALQGAERLLAERRPHLVVETHSAELERGCRDLLRAHGYEPHVVEPRRWLAEVRTGHNRWLVAEGPSGAAAAARSAPSHAVPSREAGPGTTWG
jgi:Methyltransferase FkbM domain